MALLASWGELYSVLQKYFWWVTAWIKYYRFFIKMIPTPNPPYD
uniref:Uncharacterized protein n=1 Tax=Gloeothece verrucosa (strain PCC 7822) TaxID=497965 RepID=E0UIM1_GLOV7|nr:hypothetical protein Cyan7822_0164 [Gloeothece verrucosa PCC 7822]